MKRSLFALAVIAPLLGSAAQTPPACVPSAFTEAQTWFEDARGMSHSHIGGPLPFYREVSGTVTLPIALKYHHVFGYMRRLKVDAFLQIYPTTEYRAAGEHLMDFPVRNVTAPTDLFPNDGWRMMTIEDETTDTDGVTPNRLVRLRGSWKTKNGKPATTLTANDLEGMAWFSLPAGATSPRGYSNARMAARTVPIACVSGTWPVLVTAASSIAGQTRNLRVALDPDLHKLPTPDLGTTLLQVSGMVGRWQTVSIDTTKLTVGDHKLMIVSDDKGMFQVPVPGTLSGVLVKGFTVAPR